ncbi:MAG: proline dehydrogenase family protein, partial [Myxococcota bacterium]
MLAQLVPGLLVRFFARPYVAGGDADAALVSAALNLESGLYTTLDLLGEDVTTAAQVEKNADVYATLIRALAKDARFVDDTIRPTVSLKPSAFTVGGHKEAFDTIDPFVLLAHEHGVGLSIDMV